MRLNSLSTKLQNYTDTAAVTVARHLLCMQSETFHRENGGGRGRGRGVVVVN